MITPLIPVRVFNKLRTVVVVHTYLQVRRACKHTATQFYLVWSPVFGLIASIGTQIEHVYVLQIRTFGHTRVVQHQVEVGVGIARPQQSVEVPEGYAAQIAVTSESVEVHVCQAIVVKRTNVVVQAQLTVFAQVRILNTHSREILDGVLTRLFFNAERIQLK